MFAGLQVHSWMVVTTGHKHQHCLGQKESLQSFSLSKLGALSHNKRLVLQRGRSYCKERSKHSSILKSNCVDEHTEQGSTVEMTRLRFVTFSWELMRTFFFYYTFTSFCHFNFQAEPNVCS